VSWTTITSWVPQPAVALAFRAATVAQNGAQASAYFKKLSWNQWFYGVAGVAKWQTRRT